MTTPTTCLTAPEYRVRAATASDYDFLWTLHCRALRSSVEATWGWDDADQAQRFRRRFNPAGQQIVLVGEAPVGMLEVVEADEIFIANIQLLPAWQSHGLGTALLGQVIAHARSRKVPITLRVLRVNRARRLYERLGFSVYGETETHLLMRLPG